MKVTFIALSIIFMASSLKAQTNTLLSGVYNLDSIKAPNTAVIQGKIKLQGNTTDLDTLSVHTSTLAPGKTNHPPRALYDREELIIVKEGQLTITINDSSKILSAGSIALIVAGDQQSFHNASDKPVSYFVLAFKSTSPVNISRGKASGGSLMKDWNELTVKKTNKGESRPVFDRPSSMFERFEVHASAVNALEDNHLAHTHRAEEIMFLMKGNITMNIAQQKIKAGPGNIILIRPDVLHNLTNTGNEQCWYYAIKWYNSAGEKEGVK